MSCDAYIDDVNFVLGAKKSTASNESERMMMPANFISSEAFNGTFATPIADDLDNYFYDANNITIELATVDLLKKERSDHVEMNEANITSTELTTSATNLLTSDQSKPFFRFPD